MKQSFRNTQSRFFIAIILLLITISISSCAARKRHRGCDCPSFSQTELPQNDQGRI